MPEPAHASSQKKNTRDARDRTLQPSLPRSKRQYFHRTLLDTISEADESANANEASSPPAADNESWNSGDHLDEADEAKPLYMDHEDDKMFVRQWLVEKDGYQPKTDAGEEDALDLVRQLLQGGLLPFTPPEVRKAISNIVEDPRNPGGFERVASRGSGSRHY